MEVGADLERLGDGVGGLMKGVGNHHEHTSDYRADDRDVGDGLADELQNPSRGVEEAVSQLCPDPDAHLHEVPDRTPGGGCGGGGRFAPRLF